MSIIQRVQGNKLMPMSGMSTQILAQTIEDVIETAPGGGAVPTEYVKDCNGSSPVFGDLTSDDDLKNDFTKLLGIDFNFRPLEFFLMDGNNNELAQLNDSTYGTYFTRGFLPIGVGFTFIQSRLKGYEVDWKKVLQEHGAGLYQLKTVLTPSSGEPIERKSCVYDLCQYSEDRANGTVRVNLLQNGRIKGHGLDYTGVNWVQQYRFKGFFGEKQRRIEKDEYQNKNRVVTQIQDTLIYEYTLQPYLLSECFRPIIDEIMLANDVIISDYNLLNTDDLKKISVVPVSVDTEYFASTPKAAEEFKFEERKQNRVKRNVR